MEVRITETTEQTREHGGGPRRWALLAVACTLLAVALWLCGVHAAVRAFDGANAAAYSCWNHVASELGFPFASPRTWAFNGAVAAVAVLAMPTLFALAAALRTRLAGAAAWVGAAGCVSLATMGMFGLRQDAEGTPYVFLKFFAVHATLTAVFAALWGVAITLFEVDFLRRWRDPAARWMACGGAFCWMIYPVFLVSVVRSNPTERALLRDLRDPAFRAAMSAASSVPLLSPWLDSHRPEIWGQAAMEWVWTYSVMAWLGMAVVFLWTEARRRE